MDKAEFVFSVWSLRGMNKDESKAKVGINYGQSFFKVSPKPTVYIIKHACHYNA